MHIHINGYAVALGAVCFVIGAVLWRYKKLHRLSGLGFFLGAAFLVIGVVPWLDALAALTASGTGLVILLLVDVVGGFGFWFEALRKHQYHRIRTPVLTIAFGTAIVVTYGSLARVLHEATISPGKTTHALAQSVAQIRDGAAAHSMPGHEALVVLLAAAGMLVILIVLAGRMEKGSGPARGAIAGRRPAGRSALPAGRGRR
jgi:hypothetical protein